MRVSQHAKLKALLEADMALISPRCTCFLLVMATVLCLAGGQHVSSSEPGLTKVTLQADWYPEPEHGGFYTALVKGYYKDEGLDVTIEPLGPYLSVDKQVSSGGAQFGLGTSDRILEAIADGQPVVAIAATMQRDPQGIMVRKNSPIHTFADLNGHTVAIKTGSTWWEYIERKYQLNSVHEVPAMMNVANFIADPNYVQQAFATSEPYFAHKPESRPGCCLRVMLDTIRIGSCSSRVISCSSIPRWRASLCEHHFAGGAST